MTTHPTTPPRLSAASEALLDQMLWAPETVDWDDNGPAMLHRIEAEVRAATLTAAEAEAATLRAALVEALDGLCECNDGERERNLRLRAIATPSAAAEAALLEDADRDRALVAEWDVTLPPPPAAEEPKP